MILVVDDEPQVGRSIERLLRRNGFVVRVVQSAREALGALEGVDLVLTDMRMPGMSGLELVAEVKRLRPELRCCVMSGDAGGEATEDASPLVDSWLSKPFSHPELLAVVRGPPGEGRDP